jgi:hypothetical protein
MNDVRPSAVAAYRRAIAARGEDIVVERISGQSPNTVSFTASVQGIVMDATPDTLAPRRTGIPSGDPGGMMQTDRMVILIASDLAEKRFPLPLRKNDRITLSSTGEKTNITAVDAGKRRLAGAIEAKVAGIR